MSDDIYDRKLGQRLRTLREMHRMTQADVGARIGLSHQQIQKYETGQSQVRANLIVRLADLFQIPVSQLMEQQDMVSPTPGENLHYAGMAEAPPEPYQAEPMAESELVRLVVLFSRISSLEGRARILQLASDLAD